LSKFFCENAEVAALALATYGGMTQREQHPLHSSYWSLWRAALKRSTKQNYVERKIDETSNNDKVFIFIKYELHLVVGNMTSYMRLSHLMLQNWCMKFIYLFSAALHRLQ
jgi:hypothetical protein